jgi:hypothetical protein
MKRLIILAAVLACFAAPWLPSPIGNNAYLIPVLGFVILIFAGLRTAARHDEVGLFAFWFRPRQMAKSELDQAESSSTLVGLILIVVPVISIVIRIAITGQ